MASPTPGKTQLGLEPNLAGLLCYAPCCIGLVVSIVTVIVEKQNRFVKFHAFQSLLLHGGYLVLWLGLLVAGIVLGSISGMLSMLLFPVQIVVGLGVFALTVYLMVKAYNGEEWKLPTLGELAKNWASQ
jgi:uncharacterized membrane protein